MKCSPKRSFGRNSVRATNSAKCALRDDPKKPNQVGKLYWRGLDADGNKFDDHQRKVKPGRLEKEPGLLKRLQNLLKRDED